MNQKQKYRRIERIITESQEHLFRVAYFRTGSRAEAEDIVQTAYLRLWERGESLDDNDDVRLYLHRIVYNLCADYHRHLRPTEPLNTADNVADSSDADRELHAEYMRIGAILARIPETQREVIRMHVMDGLTFAEIARLTDTPESTLKSRLSAGIKLMRSLIDKS